MTQQISKTLHIPAPAAVVWNTLTNTGKMKQWMAEPETELEIITDWKAGSPIVIKGFHHVKFENKGTVLKFEPCHVLEYDHLSTMSRLPDRPENYSNITFKLYPSESHTLLTLTIRNFPTETIFRHLKFYWETTLDMMKDIIENQ